MEYWKKEAVDRLKAHRLYAAAIENADDLIAAERAKMTAIKSAQADGVTVNGSDFSARENALLNSICAIDKAKARKEEAQHRVSAVMRALDTLTEEDRHILDVMYINGQRGGADRLVEELFVEKTQVYKKATIALSRFQQAMHGSFDVW